MSGIGCVLFLISCVNNLRLRGKAGHCTCLRKVIGGSNKLDADHPIKLSGDQLGPFGLGSTARIASVHRFPHVRPPCSIPLSSHCLSCLALRHLPTDRRYRCCGVHSSGTRLENGQCNLFLIGFKTASYENKVLWASLSRNPPLKWLCANSIIGQPCALSIFCQAGGAFFSFAQDHHSGLTECLLFRRHFLLALWTVYLIVLVTATPAQSSALGPRRQKSKLDRRLIN